MIFKVRKTDKTLRGTIQLTPSKSISNRLLIIQAFCPEKFKIEKLATANDTVLLQKLLASSAETLNAGDAGTTLRFLAANRRRKNETTTGWNFSGCTERTWCRYFL
jgi:3-phosphoshikimate 1-carboxyvinyltransferase